MICGERYHWRNFTPESIETRENGTRLSWKVYLPYGDCGMNDLMPAHEVQNSPNYFRIAWQSALAAGLCLGFPAGLLLWLVLFRQLNHSKVIDRVIDILHN